MVSIKELLEAGVHFGHQTKRWNPKMKKFIFEERNGIYIVNLIITLEQIKTASAMLKEVGSAGKPVLFVGTKKQAKEIVHEIASQSGIFFVNERWLGGTLTNQTTIRKSVNRLKELEALQEEGTLDKLSKKEAASLKREMNKLHRNLDGIKELNKLPGAVFVVDTKKEKIAVLEANKLGIPVIAILDTNCDPDVVTYPIAGNDDAIRAIRLISSCLAQAYAEGAKKYDLMLEKLKKEEAAMKEKARQKKAHEAQEAKKAAAAKKEAAGSKGDKKNVPQKSSTSPAAAGTEKKAKAAPAPAKVQAPADTKQDAGQAKGSDKKEA